MDRFTEVLYDRSNRVTDKCCLDGLILELQVELEGRVKQIRFRAGDETVELTQKNHADASASLHLQGSTLANSSFALGGPL